MVHIYSYDDEILIEQYFVSLIFDKAEVEGLIVEHLSADYPEHIYKARIDEDVFPAVDFTFFNDDDRHNIMNDLMYLHNLEPIKIKFINNEDK